MGQKRMRVTKQSLQASAYHEAGHAIADVRFECICDRVTIVQCQEDGTLGRERSVYGGDAEHRLIACLAGYAAEIEHDPRSEPQAKLGATDDFDKARGCLRELGVKCLLAPWHKKTRQFVRDNWRAIDMVARDLVEVKTLDGYEVELIVNIADGEPDAIEALANHRLMIGHSGTRQFPFTVMQLSEE